MNTEPGSWPPALTFLPPGSLIGVLGFLGPLAWVMGNKVLASRILDAGQTSRQVNTGRICGMIGTGLLAVGLVCTVVIFGIFFIAGLAHPPRPLRLAVAV